MTEVGCLAHARRKFFDLHAANKSQVSASALQQISAVYEIERQLKDLAPDERLRIQQGKNQIPVLTIDEVSAKG